MQSTFVTSDDGVSLFIRSFGSGPPLVCCNGIGVSTFFWKYVVDHFKHTHQVVVWDYRGHGRSGSPAPVEGSDISIERNAMDLRHVIEASNLTEMPILLGHSMGCQVIMEYYKHFPNDVRALIPMFGTFARPLDTFMDFKYSRTLFEGFRKLAEMGGRNTRRLVRPLFGSPLGFKLGSATGLFDGHYAPKEDIELYINHLNEMDHAVFFRMVSAMSTHDLTDLLPQISIPVLIFAAEKDVFTPVHRAETMQRGIIDSELLVLAEASHAAIVEHPKTINRRIERFLRERVNT